MGPLIVLSFYKIREKGTGASRIIAGLGVGPR